MTDHTKKNQEQPSFIHYLRTPIFNTFLWFKKSVDINHSGLFDALDKHDWKTITAHIKHSDVNQYAHDYDNLLLFLAIEHEQHDLAQYLLTLNNVKNHPVLNTYDPLLQAIANKKPDAALFMLNHIPTIAQHLTDDSNTVLINAIFHKQWPFVCELLTNNNVINTLDNFTLDFIFQKIQSFNNNEKGLLTHLFLKHPIFQEYLKSKLNTEEFDDLKSLAEANAQLLVSYKIHEPKIKNFVPIYNKPKPESLKRKIEEIFDNDNESENLDGQPARKKHKSGDQ